MLNINMEYRKGILFVRLTGTFNNETSPKVEKEVSQMINQGGIKYLVFNIENVNYIDMSGIDAMMKNYDMICENKGKAIVCGLNNELVRYRIENSRLLKYMYETSNELSAFNIIQL